MILAYENGLERVCIYFPESVRYSIEDENLEGESCFFEEDEMCDFFPDENQVSENILGSQGDEIVLDETDSSEIFSPVCDETQTTENVSGNERNKFDLDETESSGISAPVYAENLKQKRKTRSSHDRGSILWHMKNQINILKKKLKLLSPLVKIRLQNQKIQE